MVAFVLALFASLAVHLPAYEALGYLASRWRSYAWGSVGRAAGRGADVEVHFLDAPRSQDPLRPPDPRHPDSPPHVRRHLPRPDSVPSPVLPPLVPRSPTPPPPPSEEDPPRRLAVTQRGNREEAEEARFLAREANRVDQETLARQRNLVRDDPDLRSTPLESGARSEASAGEPEEVVAELRDRDGARDRRPTSEQAVAERPDRPASERVPRRPDPALAQHPSAPPSTAEERRGAREEGPATGQEGPERAEEGLRLHDGQGTLRFEAAAGRGGGARQTEGRGGRRRTGAGPRIALVPRHPGDRPSYGELQAIYGEERFEGERQAWLQERRSRRRGVGFGARWEAFRSAIENHVPFVRPGNQTALNAAASPFADYLAAVHRRIHVEYAEKFVGRLPSYSTSPYADRTLRVTLEIAIEPDGSVGRIAVVRSSGLMAFDYGAYAAVMRAQPFPRPPRAIRSADGRVYFHWGFYRNPRLCGTFNARPFLLRSVPGHRTPRPEGPVDEPPSPPASGSRAGRGAE